MKKIISILLLMSILVSLTGCNSTNKYVETAKEYGYLYVFNSSWGMSIDECLKANKLDRKDVEILEDIMDESTKREYFAVNKRFFNQDLQIGFLFDTVIKSGISMGLSQISVVLAEPMEREIAEAKVVEFIEQQGLEFEMGSLDPMWYSYGNTNTLGGLEDRELIKQSKEFLSKAYYQEGLTQGQKESQLLSLAYTDGKSLDSVSLLSSPKEGEMPNYGPITHIYFHAGTALYLSNALFAEEN